MEDPLLQLSLMKLPLQSPPMELPPKPTMMEDGDLPVERNGTATLCMHCLDGSKESFKVKRKKYTL
jgi:hypothetical protein